MNEIFSRVSIRKFTNQPVEREKIVTMLRAAMQAPSAHNQQPWEFYVVSDKDMLEKLSHISKYSMSIKNAPVAIVSALWPSSLLTVQIPRFPLRRFSMWI